MAYDARVLTVLIASPGDVKSERDAIAEELEDWNVQHEHATAKIRLEVRRWEVNAVPVLGQGDGQTVINEQLVDEADIVIGVFHSRLGTPTPRAASGTAEELYRSFEAGKPVHVYFSTKPLPHNVDEDQLRSVRNFKLALGRRGLVATFKSTKDLRLQVRRHVTRDVEWLTTNRGAANMSEEEELEIISLPVKWATANMSEEEKLEFQSEMRRQSKMRRQQTRGEKPRSRPGGGVV